MAFLRDFYNNAISFINRGLSENYFKYLFRECHLGETAYFMIFVKKDFPR